MKRPKVSVLIATRQRAVALKKTLCSLLNCGYTGPLEVLIVDDSSEAPIAAETEAFASSIAGKAGVELCFHRNPQHLGIIQSRRFLTSKMSADSEHALYLDDDVELMSGALDKLADCLISHPGAGLAGPRIVFMKDPSRTAHGAYFVHPWTGMYSAFLGDEAGECDWLLSSCLLVRRAVLDRTEGFHGGFYISHAEVDFCLSAKRAGFSVRYCPDAIVAHDEEPGQFKRDRLYYVYRNKLMVIRRNFPSFRCFTALICSGLLALPRHIYESLAYNRGVSWPEIKLIFLALLHGLSGKEGPFNINS